jgi:hypothetical protein
MYVSTSLFIGIPYLAFFFIRSKIKRKEILKKALAAFKTIVLKFSHEKNGEIS